MKKFINQGNKDTRSGFGEGLTELGRNISDVVALCADLTGSLKMNTFADENPERFFQVGIAEANMMGLAAGLATGGKFPLPALLQIFLLEEFTIKLDNLLPTHLKMLKSAHHMLGLLLARMARLIKYLRILD